MSNADQRLELARAYRSLFLNEDGSFKSDAEIVIRDIEKITGWMVTSLPISKDGSVDPYQAVANLAKRKTFAHIKDQLFKPLEQLKRKTEQ